MAKWARIGTKNTPIAPADADWLIIVIEIHVISEVTAPILSWLMAASVFARAHDDDIYGPGALRSGVALRALSCDTRASPIWSARSSLRDHDKYEI
jgi:hypothetical protein